MKQAHGQPGQKIDVRIENGGLSARILINPTECGDELSLEMVEAEVRRRGVRIDDEVHGRLNEIVQDCLNRPRRIETEFATGAKPTDGEDGWMEWTSRFDPSQVRGEDGEDEQGRVDYRAMASYLRVSVGDHVATVYPPGPHTDGRDVRGDIIRAKPGAQVDTFFDSSFETQPDGRVIANRNGVIRQDGNKVYISALFEVPGSVDYSVGNVDFDGCVSVREGVADLFQVKATGDLQVGGLVESATIECGGSLLCRQGIAGKERASLRVGGSLQANYLNDVSGEVGGDIIIAREVIGCTLSVGGNVDCARGAIIGGHIALGGSMTVTMLGSRAHAPTLIEFRRSEGGDVARERQSIEVRDRIHSKVAFRSEDEDLVVRQSIAGPVTIGPDLSGELMLTRPGHHPEPLRLHCDTRRAAA